MTKIKQNVNSTNIINCTGCGACSVLCPKECIVMGNDKEGFYKPSVNSDSCIGCSKCLEKCPAIHDYSCFDLKTKKKAYAFKNSNEEDLLKSTSGGFFSAVSDYIFEKNGVVVGCIFNEEFVAIHSSATNLQGIKPMRGSKYVESKSWLVYSNINKWLDEGKPVLFSGTSCQIAGLYAVLGKKYDNLYTVEILCHGVPSHLLFSEYIKYIEKVKGKIIEYNFRDKKLWGWGSWGTYYYLDANKKTKRYNLLPENDFFYYLYFQENNYRESCYTCKYARNDRIGDITLGDFWGIEHVLPEKDTKDGFSLVIENTVKGEKLISLLRTKGKFLEFSYEQACEYNSTLLNPASRPSSRDTFYHDFLELGFEKCSLKYCKLKYFIPVVSRYIPRRIKNIIKSIIKNIINR